MGYTDNLAEEFATVDLLLPSETRTGRTDAFILSWVKVEKQIRRVFVYTIFQFQCFSAVDNKGIRDLIADNTGLYFRHFAKGFNELIPKSLKVIVGSDYQKSLNEIDRIKRHRDKILHGQLTKEELSSTQLRDEVEILRDWIRLLAEKLWSEIGYDGLSNVCEKSQRGDFPKLNARISSLDDLGKFIRTSMPSGRNGVKWTDIR